MTAGSLAILGLGMAMAVFVAWALWPRRRARPGPHNNWRQRSGDEVASGKTRAAGLEDVPHSIGYGSEGD